MADGAVSLRFLGHATVLLELDGVRVLTDPFLRARLGPLERHGPLPDPAWYSGIDVALISHGHRDHFDPESLAAIPGEPVVIAPRGLGAACRRVVRGDVVELVAGESWTHPDLHVEAVPARHWVSPGAPRADPIGFVVRGSSRVYFAGDTGKFDALGRLRGEVDVALIPVWTWGPHRGPGHLGPRSAAEVAAMIQPALAVPIHWATLYPRHLHRLWRRPLAEPGARFATHVGELAPAVETRVLTPGQATTWDHRDNGRRGERRGRRRP